jgi:hypothetical protein
MSVMGVCAYLRAAELTVYGFPQLTVFQSLTILFGPVSATGVTLSGTSPAPREGHSRPLVPRIKQRVMFFPTPQLILRYAAQSPFPKLWRYIWAQHGG